MKTITISKISLSIILFLVVSSITLNAQNIKDATLKNNNSSKTQKAKAETTKNDSKQNSEFKSYQKWNKNYAKDKYQRGSISSH